MSGERYGAGSRPGDAGAETAELRMTGRGAAGADPGAAETERSGAAPDRGGSGARRVPVRSRVPRALWILPVLTFLGGLALGAVLMGIGADPAGVEEAAGNGAETGTEQPTPTPTTTDVTVTVPGSCLDAAQYSEELLALGNRTTDALSGFDVSALRAILADMQALQPELREAAERCRADAEQQ